MNTLLDFFDRYIRGPDQALIEDDGFRRRLRTRDDLHAAADRWAARLRAAGVMYGDRVAIWGESCPEWVAAFWGCILCGAAVVPVDASATCEFVGRVVAAASPSLLVVGEVADQPPVVPGVPVWRLRDVDWSGGPPESVRDDRITPETVAEIVFTSGTTGDPKGVVISHRNILANIAPIERQVVVYRRYLWPFRPVRFLGLLPLSHMFGQALSIFFPPLVNGATVFMKGYNPDQVIAMTKRHRVTLIVTVPRVLDLLRDRLSRSIPALAAPFAPQRPLVARILRGRGARRMLGWRCVGFVVGGAPLETALEDYWRGLGFAVIQGYGLTETAPIVAWNHPFKLRPGTVGRPIEGVDVRLADDGEILVRGPTVTAGYWRAPEQTQSAFDGEWFRTGDIGSFDADGHLVIRGRKKDVIATAEGLKVFPDDVERVLERAAGVTEAAVIGRRDDHAEYVHAVLRLSPGADPEAIVSRANGQLEPHQRIRDFTVWTAGPMPRTEPMRKLKRFEIRRRLETGSTPAPAAALAAGDPVERLLSKYAQGRTLDAGTTLDALGLTSLDRIELMLALEEQGHVTLSEAAMGEARTVGDLRRLAERAPAEAVAAEAFPFPSWNQWRLVRALRNVSQPSWILPLAGLYLRVRASGLQHLDGLQGPIILAANHQSHFDTPAILRALPRRWRRTVAVAMAKEYFEPHFFPERHTAWERLLSSAIYYLVATFFAGFPLPQQEPGARETLRYIGDLVTNGASILLFPEGIRTERGEIGAFQPGVGLLGAKLELPVVPVRLEGVDRVLHHTWRWPRRGTVTVTFGPPLMLEGEDYRALARKVQDAVLALR